MPQCIQDLIEEIEKIDSEKFKRCVIEQLKEECGDASSVEKLGCSIFYFAFLTYVIESQKRIERQEREIAELSNMVPALYPGLNIRY